MDSENDYPRLRYEREVCWKGHEEFRDEEMKWKVNKKISCIMNVGTPWQVQKWNAETEIQILKQDNNTPDKRFPQWYQESKCHRNNFQNRCNRKEFNNEDNITIFIWIITKFLRPPASNLPFPSFSKHNL